MVGRGVEVAIEGGVTVGVAEGLGVLVETLRTNASVGSGVVSLTINARCILKQTITRCQKRAHCNCVRPIPYNRERTTWNKNTTHSVRVFAFGGLNAKQTLAP